MSGQANSVLQQEMPFDTVMRQSPLGMAVIAMDGTEIVGHAALVARTVTIAGTPTTVG